MSRYLLTEPSQRLTCSGLPSKVSGALILISPFGVVVDPAIVRVVRDCGDSAAKVARVCLVNSEMWSGSSISSDEDESGSSFSVGGEGGIGSGSGSGVRSSAGDLAVFLVCSGG